MCGPHALTDRGTGNADYTSLSGYSPYRRSDPLALLLRGCDEHGHSKRARYGAFLKSEEFCRGCFSRSRYDIEAGEAGSFPPKKG